jgi:hypothetical protein
MFLGFLRKEMDISTPPEDSNRWHLLAVWPWHWCGVDLALEAAWHWVGPRGDSGVALVVWQRHVPYCGGDGGVALAACPSGVVRYNVGENSGVHTKERKIE